MITNFLNLICLYPAVLGVVFYGKDSPLLFYGIPLIFGEAGPH